jgi:hypothetical protein
MSKIIFSFFSLLLLRSAKAQGFVESLSSNANVYLFSVERCCSSGLQIVVICSHKEQCPIVRYSRAIHTETFVFIRGTRPVISAVPQVLTYWTADESRLPRTVYWRFLRKWLITRIGYTYTTRSWDTSKRFADLLT